ncbi:hypothetical protein [Hymenobacter sp. UYP22]
MTDKQHASLTMMQATLAVLDQHAGVYATNKALSAVISTGTRG